MVSNIFSSLGALGGNYTNWIIPFLFTLTVIVFFHELGHFLVARWCGIRVLVFSIGFGPELVGFYDRSGTRWKISAIPLGGYVKFFGDENEAGRCTIHQEPLGVVEHHARWAGGCRLAPRSGDRHHQALFGWRVCRWIDTVYGGGPSVVV